MWVFLHDAFLSIVEDTSDGNKLLVRARVKGDIERVFEDLLEDQKVEETNDRDYRFRISLPRSTVAFQMESEVLGIEYPNFKSEVKETDRHNAYLDVWFTMTQLQASRKLAERGVRDNRPAMKLIRRLNHKLF